MNPELRALRATIEDALDHHLPRLHEDHEHAQRGSAR